MSARGGLTKGQLGFSMPPYAPLFPKPPFFYTNATVSIFFGNLKWHPDDLLRFKIRLRKEIVYIPDNDPAFKS